MNADTLIKNIAKEAGEIAWKRFGKDGMLYMKSEGRYDGVTKADIMLEKLIISRIAKYFPEDGIIAEESGSKNINAEYVWIIDPIDGTYNFMLNVPQFAVMVARARRKKVELSAIYVPANKELFFAKAKGGAFVNGKKIRCSSRKDFGKSFGSGSASLRGAYAGFMTNLVRTHRDKHVMFSSSGSIGLNAAYVASGRKDWMVALFGGIHDFTPVSLLLKESGCTVTNSNGAQWTMDDLEMVAANPTLHKELIRLLKNAK